MRRSAACAFVLLAMLLPGKSWAEVADSGATGFTVKHSYLIQAAPAEVYRRLLRVGEWWNSEHTYSRDARNLSIEDHAGGCFCEKLANGSVLHMTVVFASPGKLLRMSGGLGPLQTVASAGSMTVELQPEGAGTRLNLTYMVSGYQAGGMASWAAPVNQVLGEQFGRLKNLIESGDPAVAAQPK